MTLIPGTYDLPDIQIISKEGYPDYRLFAWVPDKIYIIIGAANQVDKSVITDNAINDNAVILKRPSGGESVILTPKTLVISTLVHENQISNPKSHFNKINSLIIEILQRLNIQGLNQKGISDISIGEKKILGSGIYRKSGILFYHAVLNVSESTALISRYLKHPQREPDYRQGRNHSEFVSSLHEQGYHVSPESIHDLIMRGNYQ
jgi:lipoate---protein ligase